MKDLPYMVWKKLSHDDLIAENGDYVLRVEMMSKGSWWWEVTYKGNPTDTAIKLASSMLEAVTNSLIEYAKHYYHDTKLPETD